MCYRSGREDLESFEDFENCRVLFGRRGFRREWYEYWKVNEREDYEYGFEAAAEETFGFWVQCNIYRGFVCWIADSSFLAGI